LKARTSRVSRSFGTRNLAASNPALKRRAIVGRRFATAGGVMLPLFVGAILKILADDRLKIAIRIKFQPFGNELFERIDAARGYKVLSLGLPFRESAY
jgi:hypothetical protein